MAEEAQKNGFSKLAILGTKYLMVGPVYPKTLDKFDISYEIPDENDREQIDKIIFNELVNSIFTE
ncbi:MAG: aspartate/glutamate racemase family protein, partial [Deltaproteobacteria bacterium]|nr:aspartate/glutamate racemase family protein [Deltaproteobacteria bacterium]